MRQFGLMFVAVISFFMASCGGSIGGSVVGRWESTEGPMVADWKMNIPGAKNVPIKLLFDFQDNGVFALYVHMDNKYFPVFKGNYSIDGEYIVLAPTDSPDKKLIEKGGKIKAELNGDELKLTDKAGTTVFKRAATETPTKPTATTKK